MPDEPTDKPHVMTKEEYANQPESNVGATADRDIDPPHAKKQPEEDTEEEDKKRAENEEKLRNDAEQERRNYDKTRPEVLAERKQQEAEELHHAEEARGNDVTGPLTAAEAEKRSYEHANQVTEQQQQKLGSK